MANTTKAPARQSAVLDRPVPAATEETAHQYESIEKGPEFQQLMRAKRSFIIPAMVVFLVYYFLMLILNNYAPDLMNTKVLGDVNLAYLAALSQFVLAWVIAFLYLRAANRTFDGLVTRIVESARRLRESAVAPVIKSVKPGKGGRR